MVLEKGFRLQDFTYYASNLSDRFLKVHLKICRYVRLYIKTICWITFWVIRTRDMWKVCLQTFRKNRICWKLAYFLRTLRTSRANNSRILRIKNMKLSGYCFYINTNTQGDFQICITVPLNLFDIFKFLNLEQKFSSAYNLLYQIYQEPWNTYF